MRLSNVSNGINTQCTYCVTVTADHTSHRATIPSALSIKINNNKTEYMVWGIVWSDTIISFSPSHRPPLGRPYARLPMRAIKKKYIFSMMWPVRLLRDTHRQRGSLERGRLRGGVSALPLHHALPAAARRARPRAARRQPAPHPALRSRQAEGRSQTRRQEDD